MSMSPIEVIRKNYPATVKRNRRTGAETWIPERHKCSYLYRGMEIATYSSTSDTIYLRTDIIGSDFTKTAYERALTCRHHAAYEYLFGMLGVDETSTISEYTYA